MTSSSGRWLTTQVRCWRQNMQVSTPATHAYAGHYAWPCSKQRRALHQFKMTVRCLHAVAHMDRWLQPGTSACCMASMQQLCGAHHCASRHEPLAPPHAMGRAANCQHKLQVAEAGRRVKLYVIDCMRTNAHQPETQSCNTTHDEQLSCLVPLPIGPRPATTHPAQSLAVLRQC